MNKGRSRRKMAELKRHRQVVYEAVLDAVIAGRKPPEYLGERFKKLKEVR